MGDDRLGGFDPVAEAEWFLRAEADGRHAVLMTLRGSGVSEDLAASMTGTLAGIAHGIAERVGVGPWVVLDALRSALVGEPEPVSRLGLVVPPGSSALRTVDRVGIRYRSIVDQARGVGL